MNNTISHSNKSVARNGLIALAFGTFGLGMTEFVMMSILPDIARSFHCSIAQAGHLISSYALGVCIGAPASAIFLRKWKLKNILLLLMVIYAIGNFMFANSQSFTMALISRFITGLPHGAYFGTGSVLASRLMPDKSTTAVALMTMGMTVANIAGIPIGSFIANNLNWRWIFYFNSAWGVLTLGTLSLLVKDQESLTSKGIKGIFGFLKSGAPWLLIVTTILCQGGAFAMYSYVSPIMTHAGLSLKAMPVMMLIVGIGMFAGNYFSGIISDRYSPTKTLSGVTIVMTLSLVATYFDCFSIWTAGATITIAAVCLFALSSPMQLLLIEYSPGGELMGGAMVQVAFNLGNAVGAYLGGLPLTAGHSPQTSSLVGSAMALLSIVILHIFIKRYQPAAGIQKQKSV